MSVIWTTCLVFAMRSSGIPGWSRSSNNGLAPLIIGVRCACYGPRSAKGIAVDQPHWPNLASQMRVAFASIAWKYRLQFAGRTGDDPQHFRGRGLLLQRLVRSRRAQFAKQPRVLDGDDRLISEGLDERNCLSVNGLTSNL